MIVGAYVAVDAQFLSGTGARLQVEIHFRFNWYNNSFGILIKNEKIVNWVNEMW